MLLSLLEVSLLCTAATGSVITARDHASSQEVAIVVRGEPANQPNGYKPQISACPASKPSARSAGSLSPQEQSWLPTRRNATIEPMRALLSRLNITGFDAASYISTYSQNVSALPNIGIAVSGGGYRAMLNGAGVVAAFDSRTINSTGAGHLGGLLQSATYLSGLSGGNWLVGSLYTNNFTSVQAITRQSANANNNLWQFQNSIFQGPSSSHAQFLSSLGYYGELVDQVDNKEKAGFNTTVTDYWGRALSYQLINATNGGPDYTISSIANQNWFTSGSAPLPILIADSRAPKQTVVSFNSTVYEFNPWEMGSFDPTTYAFTPLKYLGTNYSAGVPSSDQCVTGFDSASFVMGTSSSLFNAIFTTVNGTNTTGFFNNAVKDAVAAVLAGIGKEEEDIASYPNPFYAYANGTDPAAVSPQLTLVDGGEDGQNIPLNPLTQPIRQVDVIFAVDSSADTTDTNPSSGSAPGWPDGYALMKTYERSLTPIANGTSFPAVPDTNTFYNLGLNLRPTFFGCNASNTSTITPLVVYMPNGPYVYQSNYSTFDMEYSPAERDAVINNAYNMATQGNGTIDSDWPACVGCAILSRSFGRTKTSAPDICNRCFSRYCWNGTTDTRTPRAFQPSLILSSAQIRTNDAARPVAGAVFAVTTLSVLAMLML